MPEIQLDEPMGFGKYANTIARVVIGTDPDYIKWMMSETQRSLSN